MQQWWKWLAPAGIVIGAALLVAGGIAPAQGSGAWPAWTTPGSKIVPIVSVGTPGVRLGMAQVSGPAKQMPQVKAVLQLDADFKSARAKILVPSNSMTDLRRVQGTAVTAVVQYNLLSFSRPKAAPAKTAAQQSKSQKAYKKHHGHKKHGSCKHGR